MKIESDTRQIKWESYNYLLEQMEDMLFDMSWDAEDVPRNGMFKLTLEVEEA